MKKKQKIAIVTQSYKGDLKECKLLCESIDKFVDKDIDHYIFVNDEDYSFFVNSDITTRHIIKKKSALLPKYWLNFPYKFLGHKYYISPLTIPVREWIIQQICKLAAFEVIKEPVEAIVNIDSETVFMRPFHITDIYNYTTDRYIFFKETFKEEPYHEEYCAVSKQLCDLPESVAILRQYCYMSHPVVFVRENINKLLDILKKNSFTNNWKNRLGNTYRFSEYYLYGLFTDYILNLKNHFITSRHLFPMVDIGQIDSEDELKKAINNVMNNKECLGVWLQKSNRNSMTTKYIDFNKIESVIRNYWKDDFHN